MTNASRIDSRDQRGLTALHRAIHTRDLAAMRTLLKEGASPNVAGPGLGDGPYVAPIAMVPPIELDSERNAGGMMLTEDLLPHLELLVAHGADPNNPRLGSHHTHPRALDLLIEHGAEVRLAALPMRSASGLEHLLKLGALPGELDLKKAVEGIDTRVDVVKMVELLLAHGPSDHSLRAAVETLCSRALHATEKSLVQSLQLLPRLVARGAVTVPADLQQILRGAGYLGSRLRDEALDDARAWALELACIAANALRPLVPGEPRLDLLHEAARLGSAELARALIAKGFSASERDARGRLPRDLTKDRELRLLLVGA